MSDTITIDPVPSDPVVTDPVPSDPVPSDPVVTDPVPSDPVVSDPVPSDPVVTDPVVTDPVVTDPVVTDPVVTRTRASIATEITKTWNITNMTVIKQTPDFQNLVIVATYKYSGTYTDPTTGTVYASSISGDVNLSEPTNDTNYIPYENLTENIVLGWVIPQMNISYLDSYITNEITNQIMPPEIYNGIPW